MQALGLLDGGADYLLLETCQDTRNVKAALLGIEDAFGELGWRIPVAVSVTIETMGTMLAGQDVEALAVSLEHADLLYLGLNCATGPEFMTRPHALARRAGAHAHRLRAQRRPARRERQVPRDPRGLPPRARRFLDHGWLNLVGGCCGTTPATSRRSRSSSPASGRAACPEHSRALVSGIEAVELTDDNRPVLVGERTNVIGSRKFKELIVGGQVGGGGARSAARR